MRLVIIGCAGTFPSAGSAASAYLVQADDADGRTWNVLLDLGNGALGALERWADPEALDAIVLSHLHADHCSDMSVLAVRRRYHPDGALPPLPVWGPAGTATRIDQLAGADHATRASGQYELHAIVAGSPVRFGPLVVEPVAVHHTVEAYGLRIAGPSETDPGCTVTVSYTGDTDEGPGLNALADGADLLLAEAAFHEGRDDAVRGVHLTALRAARAAARGGSGLLVLTHLPSWNDPDRAVAEARQVWDGPLDLAVPGRVYAV